MESLRTFFRHHRILAGVLLTLALCLKIAVPTGFMVGNDIRSITIVLCHDADGSAVFKKLTLPAKADADDLPGKPVKGECPYAALSMVTLAGAEPVLLALALAFIMALGFAPAPLPPLRHQHRLRPPLRGPPR